MSCLPENAPVTGALRVAFVVLLVLLVAAFALQQRIRPRPILRAYAGISSLFAFVGMMFAIDIGATEAELWRWVVAPIALAVFSLYAERFRPREPSLAVAASLRREDRLTRPRNLVHADQAMPAPAFRE